MKPTLKETIASFSNVASHCYTITPVLMQVCSWIGSHSAYLYTRPISLYVLATLRCPDANAFVFSDSAVCSTSIALVCNNTNQMHSKKPTHVHIHSPHWHRDRRHGRRHHINTHTFTKHQQWQHTHRMKTITIHVHTYKHYYSRFRYTFVRLIVIIPGALIPSQTLHYRSTTSKNYVKQTLSDNSSSSIPSWNTHIALPLAMCPSQRVIHICNTRVCLTMRLETRTEGDVEKFRSLWQCGVKTCEGLC